MPNLLNSTLSFVVRSSFFPARRIHELTSIAIVLPGMDARLVDIAANSCMALLESKKRIDISDLQLDWRPIYAILEKELFPKQRKTGLTFVHSLATDSQIIFTLS